jgi:DSF synthase
MSTVTPLVTRITPAQSYRQLDVHIDQQYGLAWCYMHSATRPCFSAAMLDDLNNWFAHLRDHADALDLHYHVIASAMPEAYNLGGDLDLFRRLIQARDRSGLLEYGIKCIDALYANMRLLDSAVTTISLVQGNALGGGFEAALSSDVLIAERGVRMGFPEILFNLFPGMGAYSLLSRKLDAKRAERMILSGDLFSAEDLHEMGLVDVLVEPGDGELAVYDYIKRERRARNGFQGLRRARDRVQRVAYEELRDIVELWVDTALRLETRDLRMMQRLVARQTQMGAAAA